MVRKFYKIIAGALVMLLLLQCYVPVFAMGFDGEFYMRQEQNEDEVTTIGDATRLDAPEEEGGNPQNSSGNEEPITLQINPTDSLYESSATMLALTGTEQTAIIQYMDSNMVGAPYNYTGGYTNSKAAGWCCAGAVSRVLYYAYDCRDIVTTCDNPSWVPSIRISLDQSSSFEKVYDSPLCFKGLAADEVNALYSRVTQGGDIIIFYGPEGNTQPHCGIAGGGNVLYSALVHTGFSPTTIAYYVCSGTHDPKAAGGMAVFRKKTVLGSLRVCKSSEYDSITGGNNIYSMAGVVYGVSTSKEVDGNGLLKNQVGTMMIEDDRDNISNNANLEPGEYYIQEIKAPSSNTYLLNKKIYGPYEVQANHRTTVGIPSVEHLESLQPGTYVKEKISDTPKYYKNGLQIIKKDAEGIGVFDDSAWKDVEFTVRYYSSFYDNVESVVGKEPTRTWILKAKKESNGNYVCKLDQDHLVAGSDELYFSEDKDVAVIPYGTLTVEETKAPIGYNLSGMRFYSQKTSSFYNGIFLTQIKNMEGEIVLESGNELVAYDYKIRGDLEFKKVSQEDMTPMAGIPFAITSKTTGETHILVTDQEGYCSTSASYISHLYQTNGNDYLLSSDSGILVSGQEETSLDLTEEKREKTKTGIWFFGNEKQDQTSLISDERGALLYDTYIVQELACKENEGYQLLDPFEVVVDKESVVVDGQILTNAPSPIIYTSAWEKNSKTQYASVLNGEDNVIDLVDTVTYRWLKAGGTYTIKGCLVDKESGEVVKDVDGNYVQNLEKFSVDENFTQNPYEKCGTIDINYSVKLQGLEGKETIFFEYLFEGDDENVLVDELGVIRKEGALSCHDDLDSQEQMIGFAGIGTKAFIDDGKKLLELDGDATEQIIIQDEVDFCNLKPNNSYKLEAQLMYYDELLGKELPLKNSDGAILTAVKTFVPTESSGQVTVIFDPIMTEVLLDENDILLAKELVVYERLYCDDILIVEECSMENEDQTLLFEVKERPKSTVLDAKEDSPENPLPKDTPKTGDVFKLKIFVALMLITAGGIAGLLIFKNRSKSKGNV